MKVTKKLDMTKGKEYISTLTLPRTKESVPFNILKVSETTEFDGFRVNTPSGNNTRVRFYFTRVVYQIPENKWIIYIFFIRFSVRLEQISI